MDPSFAGVTLLLVATGTLLWWEITASRWLHDFEWDHLEEALAVDDDDVFGDPDSDYDETGNPVG